MYENQRNGSKFLRMSMLVIYLIGQLTPRNVSLCRFMSPFAFSLGDNVFHLCCSLSREGPLKISVGFSWKNKNEKCKHHVEKNKTKHTIQS